MDPKRLRAIRKIGHRIHAINEEAYHEDEAILEAIRAIRCAGNDELQGELTTQSDAIRKKATAQVERLIEHARAIAGPEEDEYGQYLATFHAGEPAGGSDALTHAEWLSKTKTLGELNAILDGEEDSAALDAALESRIYSLEVELLY